jgi:hypothetical protein
MSRTSYRAVKSWFSCICWDSALRSARSSDVLCAQGTSLSHGSLYAAQLKSHSFMLRSFASASRGRVSGQAHAAPQAAARHGLVHFTSSGHCCARRLPWQTRRSFATYIPPDNIVYGIMACNFGVFVAWQQPQLRRTMSAHFTTSYSHLRAGYLHTLLTSSVSHSSMAHMFSNMFTFYFFGNSLGNVIGAVRVRSQLLYNGIVRCFPRCSAIQRPSWAYHAIVGIPSLMPRRNSWLLSAAAAALCCFCECWWAHAMLI